MISVLNLDAWFDLGLLKKFFLILSFCILSFIPLEILRTSFLRKSHFTTASSPAANSSAAVFNQSAAEYEAALDKFTLFGHATSNEGVVLKSSIADLIKDYRLRGVVLIGEPEAIIEDARTQKTTFVKKGDQLGELTVKDIKEGKIVLKYYGEEKVIQIE